jgi:hypothetical protein
MSENNLSDKLKEINTEKLQNFYHRNTTEILSAVALAIGGVSSSWDFFTGPKFAILFFVIGAIIGVFFPSKSRHSIKAALRYLYKGSSSGKSALVLGLVQIVVALFVPFLLFGFYGVLSGTALDYFLHLSEIDATTKQDLSGLD